MTFPTIVFNVTATIRVINPDSSSILKKETQSFHLFPPENSKFLVSWILRYASLLHPSNKGTHPMYNTVKKKRERESSPAPLFDAQQERKYPIQQTINNITEIDFFPLKLSSYSDGLVSLNVFLLGGKKFQTGFFFLFPTKKKGK